MNPSGGGYGITIPSGMTSLTQIARAQPSYQATFNLINQASVKTENY